MHTLVKVSGFRGKTTVVLTLLALLLMMSGVAGFGGASAKAIPSNCIVDDSNGNQLQFDKTTGAYTFTNCGNFTLSGVGTVTIKGSTITLKHVSSDRRLYAEVDETNKKGSASLAVYPSGVLRTIMDRNTVGDVCGCQAM
jgi:hypothetical protein